MKRAISVFLIIGLFLSLCACGADAVSLDSVQKMPREELEDKLLGLSHEEIHQMWGQPDSFLSGLWGDIYLLPEDDMMIVLYYEAESSYGDNGHVCEFKIVERQTK